MKQQQYLYWACSLLLLLLLCLPWTKGLAQPPAAAPAPPGLADIISILQKAGHFTSFMRLIKSTNVDVQINSQLKSSSDGITVLAPSDGAFPSLKDSSLNSLTQKQKVELIQFHVVTQLLLTSQFDTVSNPVMTLAGSGGRLALNITTKGNSAYVTTGLTRTSISGSIYRDNQVAVYQVNKVLLPFDIFAPAPAPVKPEAESPHNDVAKDASGTPRFVMRCDVVLFGVGIVSAIFCL